jgi:endonuclease YncB( thermonuclease family)
MMELLQLILVLATVVGVADGNTILVKDNTGKPITVKLACINSPKVTGLATQRLKQLLPSQSPVVIRSTEQLNNGLTVGEVFVDNRSVNLRLVEEGNAVVDQETLSNCYETKTQFLIAEANAKNKRLGLWKQSNNSGNQSKTYSGRGKLIYQEVPGVMSPQAYGGKEFFLITNSPNESRLVLRPSVEVSRSQLQSFDNREVEITAVYVEGTRPLITQGACLVDIDGQCMPQGDGYQVLSIVQLKSHSK